MGHPIRYGREAKIVHGTLYCVLGDTLAAQLLGGFKEGVGMAEKPCRTCEITHTQLSDSLMALNLPCGTNKNIKTGVINWTV